MGLVELILLAAGLSMDAFAVAVCKGLAMKKAGAGACVTVGVWFGGFQALMPIAGYLLGVGFKDYISAFDHWVAFVLLGLIGANMLREAVWGGDEDAEDSLSVRSMFPLAVATSIDALAVGVTFAFVGVNIVLAVALIGFITFAISSAGVRIGNIFGAKYKKKAEIAGGVILILLGVKILLEHLGVISF